MNDFDLKCYEKWLYTFKKERSMFKGKKKERATRELAKLKRWYKTFLKKT